MKYLSKLFKDSKISKFLKEVGVNIGKKNREDKHKVKKKKHNCDFSDNDDDDNWTY
jgi:hypothetical protein